MQERNRESYSKAKNRKISFYRELTQKNLKVLYTENDHFPVEAT